MKIKKANLAVALGCLGSIAAMNIGQAGVTTLSINYNYSVGNESVRQGNTVHHTIATAFVATRTGGALLPTGHPDPFLTFCLSIEGNLASGQNWTSGGFGDPLASDSLRQTDSLYRAANLYSHYAAGVLSLGLGTHAGRVEGAALQLAIWEVLYEPNPSDVASAYNVLTSATPTTGFAVVSGVAAVNTRANQILASPWSAIDYNIETTFWNSQAGNQDLIGPLTGTSVAVPEPATMIAGALLLLPFGASTVRILRKNRKA